MSNSLLEPNKDILSRIGHYVVTDIGAKRETNQDNFIVVYGENFIYYVVCDGMGGTDGGEIASQMTVSYIDSELKGKKISDIEDVKKVVYEANERVFEYGMEHKEVQGLGTTITSLLVMPKSSWTLNVGDSRVYKIFGDTISQITEDDTVLNELIKSGVISQEKAKSHPISNMLTKTIGQGKSLEIETTRLGFLDYRERFILCSDGLYNMVSDNEIMEIISNNDVKEGVRGLIKKANDNGGIDNITAMLVGVFNQRILSDEEENNLIEQSKARGVKPQEISNNIDYNKLTQRFEEFKNSDDGKYKKLWNKTVTDHNNNEKVDVSSSDLRVLSHLIILVVLIVLGCIFVIPNNSVKLSKQIQEDKFVDKIGNIKVTEDDYKFRLNFEDKKYDDNDKFIDYSKREIIAYNEILDIVEKRESLSEEKLLRQKKILLDSNKAIESQINKLSEKINDIREYNNKNLLDIAREISENDENVKKLSDDFLSFSYDILNNDLNQNDYNKIKEEKLTRLYKQVESYFYDKISKYEIQIKSMQDKLLSNQFNLSIVDLKMQYAKLLVNNEEEKLKDFEAKINTLKQRVSKS